MFSALKNCNNMVKIKPLNLSARNSHTDGRLKGKVAIITASTDGIGYAIARRLGNEGASVIVSSRKQNNVENAVKNLRNDGITAEGVVCHVGNAEQRKKLFVVANSKFGGLDILVSNAAVNPAVSPILETEESTWDKIFEVNVKCSWLLAKEAYPELLKRGGGSIIFISSIAGYQPMEVVELSVALPLSAANNNACIAVFRLVGTVVREMTGTGDSNASTSGIEKQPLGPYSVSKTTLLGLTKAISNEVVHENIRVNCVAPGIIATKFASAITSSEAGKEKSLSIVPMKRFGKTSEIASAVAFLASDDASYITGETLVVAGGAFAHL